MNYIKKLCEQGVQKSLAPSREPFEKIVIADDDDERYSNRKYMLSGYDETISSKANDFVERNQKLIKNYESRQRKLIWPIKVASASKVAGPG